MYQDSFLQKTRMDDFISIKYGIFLPNVAIQ